VRPWKDEITWKWADGPANDEEWGRFGLYNARDTRYTRLLYLKFRAELDADPALANYYDKFFLPFSRAIAEMEHNGTFVSLDGLAKNWGVFAIQKTRAETACRALVGNPDFNPGSHQQVRKVLFEDLKLPIQEWTDGDEASTNELSLKQLKFHVLTTGEHARTIALIDALLEYREAVKMIGTYLDKYARMALESTDGRIHPWYSLIRSVSRTSSDDQQWPRDERMGGVFSAPSGKVRFGGDLSQLELRNVAHLSQDTEMLKAFRRGDDLHMLLAETITRKSREFVTKEERSNAKPGNFLLSYGAEPITYQRTVLLKYNQVVPWDECVSVHNAYHTRWAYVRKWYTDVWIRTSALGYARSPSGRIRRLPEINSTDRSKRLEALRQAINFESQELGLVIAGLCLMLATDAGLRCTQFIHDAVYCEVDDEPFAIAHAESVFADMQTSVPLLLKDFFGITYSVPLVIEAKVERVK
jgi:DNA polymerase-1